MIVRSLEVCVQDRQKCAVKNGRQGLEMDGVQRRENVAFQNRVALCDGV